jgi:hypothetical protein
MEPKLTINGNSSQIRETTHSTDIPTSLISNLLLKLIDTLAPNTSSDGEAKRRELLSFAMKILSSKISTSTLDENEPTVVSAIQRKCDYFILLIIYFILFYLFYFKQMK